MAVQMAARNTTTGTRYYALNLHSVFYHGTLEWRCFESTLHAGKVRANITLALAISAQAIAQKNDCDAENRDFRKPRLHLPYFSPTSWAHRARV